MTHTLVGACLATTRVGRVTPLAPAALVLGANLPDVDVFAYAWGEDVAMGFRRGWTHGLLAVVVLPFLLAGVLKLWDAWIRRRRRPDAPPARAAPLLLASGLAVLTHPALDWLNTYGMRWLMPFDGRWSYGDAVFIMDPWLWLALGAPWLLTRRPSVPLLAGWATLSLLVVAVVWTRAPEYAGLVLASAGVLLLALLRRPPARRRHHRIAAASLLLAAAYIVAMIGLRGIAVPRVRAELEARGRGPVARVMAGPMPVIPWTRDVVAEVPQGYVHGRWHWLPTPHLTLAPGLLRRAEESPQWPRVRDHPAVRGTLSWVRFPWIGVRESADGRRILLLDARYAREPEETSLAIEVP